MPTADIAQIAWGHADSLRILDQTLLPGEERYLELTTVDAVVEAIRVLRVRGAPLIGIAGAMGASLAGRGVGGTGGDPAMRLRSVLAACDALQATRPTAVNLPWALERVRRRARATVERGEDLHPALVAEANAIWEEDRAMCQRIGEAGLGLLQDEAIVLTHCNAGALATGGIGTALAPVYLAHRAGRRVTVIVDETRPLLQVSRLTAWELTRAGIPCTVIADGMAASRLRRGDVTCVIVGADRIAANGDVANKIGTYGLALAARAHGVPFYVTGPASTFDPTTPDGAAIPIEERNPEEIRVVQGRPVTPPGSAVWNPAFDTTPAELVTGYLTDRGLLRREQLAQMTGPSRTGPRS